MFSIPDFSSHNHTWSWMNSIKNCRSYLKLSNLRKKNEFGWKIIEIRIYFQFYSNQNKQWFSSSYLPTEIVWNVDVVVNVPIPQYKLPSVNWGSPVFDTNKRSTEHDDDYKINILRDNFHLFGIDNRWFSNEFYLYSFTIGIFISQRNVTFQSFGAWTT